MKGKVCSGSYSGPQNRKYKGWFVGSFFPDGHKCKTKQIEILYRETRKGYTAKPHVHNTKIELVLMLEGKARFTINGIDYLISDGEFIFIDPGNTISAEFLEDSKIFAIHSPSLPKDKKLVE